MTRSRAIKGIKILPTFHPKFSHDFTFGIPYILLLATYGSKRFFFEFSRLFKYSKKKQLNGARVARVFVLYQLI